MTNHTEGQWPDNICSGKIRYGRADIYDGFYLADASHGIPTLGCVMAKEMPTIMGQHVRVFNYPGQTEAIAAQLVNRWNSHDALVSALERIIERSHNDPLGASKVIDMRKISEAALALAKGEAE